MDPRLFALITLEAAQDVPDFRYDGTRTTIKDLWLAYNGRVTPENELNWGEFKARLKIAWKEGYIQLGGAAVPGVDPIDEAIELPSGKYRSFWRTIPRNSIASSIRKLKADIGQDFLNDLNQELFDAMVRHQIYLLRLSGSVRNDTFKLLQQTEADIIRQIKLKLAKFSGDGLTTPGAVQRLQWMEAYIRKVRGTTWKDVNELWVKEMSELAKTEVKTLGGVSKTISPVVIDFALPSGSLLVKIATTNPFEGRTLKEWAAAQAETDIRAIQNAIRVGMVQGETVDQMVRRIVGRGGVADVTRRQAEAIIRTAVNYVSHQARAEFINENAEAFDGERFVATLDSRTTPVCRANDGKVYPVGQGPQPPLHWNCRSIRVPQLNGVFLGERPAKSATVRGLLRDFAQQYDIDPVSKRDDLPYGMKGKFDEWSRQRIRDLTTRVASATSYQSWLETQSRAFQDDVLGPTRAKLFRAGKLTLDKFVDREGRELTLTDLARKHADAFKAAGLDPEDYL